MQKTSGYIYRNGQQEAPLAGLSDSDDTIFTDEEIEALKAQGIENPEEMAQAIQKDLERQAKYWEYGTYGVLGLLLFGGVYGLTKAVTN